MTRWVHVEENSDGTYTVTYGYNDLTVVPGVVVDEPPPDASDHAYYDALARGMEPGRRTGPASCDFSNELSDERTINLLPLALLVAALALLAGWVWLVN
jgi:hypothetical protein